MLFSIEIEKLTCFPKLSLCRKIKEQQIIHPEKNEKNEKNENEDDDTKIENDNKLNDRNKGNESNDKIEK